MAFDCDGQVFRVYSCCFLDYCFLDFLVVKIFLLFFKAVEHYLVEVMRGFPGVLAGVVADPLDSVQDDSIFNFLLENLLDLIFPTDLPHLKIIKEYLSS